MKKIPKFKTEAEEAKFWDTRDSTQFLNQMEEVSNIKFPRPKHKSVVVDLEERHIEAIKKLAQRRHLPYHSLIQRWLIEKASTEAAPLSR